MLSSLDYTFYFTVFNNGCMGTLSEKEFSLWAVRAWRELEPLLTSEPAEEHKEAVRFTICEIAEELFKTEGRQGIKSESIDGYSVTYADEVSVRRRVIELAVRRLHKTGLLYRGVDR